MVDAEPSELNEQFANLKTTWDEREASLGSLKPCFHDWFEKNCLKEVRYCMLKEKRELAGLGSPPEPFYTNDVESKNRVLKHQTDYKPQELPAFVEAMKTLFQEQKQEVEKAIMGLGEYKLSPKYSNLEISHNVWVKKNEKQRGRILQRFANTEVREENLHICMDFEIPFTASKTGSTDHKEDATESQMCDSTSNPLQSTKLPAGLQQSMWNKVQSYI